MYGKVSSDWHIKDGQFSLTIEIPANTRGAVRLPKAVLDRVTEGGTTLTDVRGRQDASDVVVEVGSGKYVFAYPWSGSSVK
jgi:alpha-L-rhamnosidase